MFQSTQHAIQGLALRARECRTPAERKMCTNVMTSLAGDLQNMSSTFRTGQSQYLQRIRGREEKKRAFFGDSELLMQVLLTQHAAVGRWRF
jgi:syntaxin 16